MADKATEQMKVAAESAQELAEKATSKVRS